MDIIKGKTWTFGENIDTDVIIPGRYLRTFNPQDLADHVLEGERPDFTKNVKKGDIIVADENFGCGSSREQAPEIIKHLNIRCVIAKSFARIFFRNSINNGLLLIENKDIPDAVREGDELTVIMNDKITFNGKDYPIEPLPDNLMEILNAGGLVKAMQKRNGLV